MVSTSGKDGIKPQVGNAIGINKGAIWKHLDHIYKANHNLPVRAVESISEARALLLLGQHESARKTKVMELLDSAERDIRTTGKHLDALVVDFGESDFQP
jgi:hypothetical protein